MYDDFSFRKIISQGVENMVATLFCLNVSTNWMHSGGVKNRAFGMR